MSTKMLNKAKQGLNLDCGIASDFYFLLYLSVFSAIDIITYITYNKRLQDTMLHLE